MIMKTVKTSLLTSLLIVVVGCDQGGDESSNLASLGQVTMNIQGTSPGELGTAASSRAVKSSTSSYPTLNVTDRAGTVVGTLELSFAKVVVEEVEIKILQSDTNTEVDFAGPYVIDLLADTVTPSFNTITMPTDTYEEIWLGFNRLTSEQASNAGLSASDPMVGYTFIVEGTYNGETAGGSVANTPFRLELSRDSGFDLSGGSASTEAGMPIVSDRINDIIVAFRMNKWLDFSVSNNWDNADIRQVSLSSGEILLNASSTGNNATIFEFLVTNMLESADYGLDSDDDGKLDSSEDDDEDINDSNDS